MERIKLPNLLGQSNILMWHGMCTSFLAALTDEERAMPATKFKILNAVDSAILNEAYLGLNIAEATTVDVLEHLLNRFHTSRIADANFEFHNRRKKLSESVVEYASDLKNLSNRVDAGMRVEELKRVFIEGLPAASRHDMYALSHGKSFDDTVVIAQQLLPKFDPRFHNGPKAQQANKGHHNRNRNDGKSRKDLECHFCHKRGHKKMDCYSNPESPNFKKNSKN